MKEEDAQPRVMPHRPFRTLVRYNRPYARAYAAGAGLALLFVLVNLALPLVIRAIVASFENQTVTHQQLYAYVAILIGIALGSGVARYHQRMLMIGASRKFEFDLRNDYFRHVQRLGRRFFQRTPTGDIMARATNDLNYVREFIGPGIMYSVDMLSVPFTLGLMIYLSPRLTAFALIPLPFVSILVYFFVRYMNRQSKVVQEQFAVVTNRVQENLAGARVVKAHGIADRELETFARESAIYMRENVKLTAITSFAWPMIGLLVGATLLTVIWQGGKMVIGGTLTLADMSALMICMLMLAWPLAQFGWVLSLYQRGAVGMNRLSGILAETPEIQDGAGTDPEAAVERGAISLEAVTFRYDGAEVLHELTLEVPAGATLAIVGRTGSGKSTLVSLLTREYDPVSGVIRIDGHDTRRIPLAELRRKVVCVPQDAFIFSESIRDNVMVGNMNAPEEAFRAACDIAQFSADIAGMPAGADTLLGERGINLSGGQKQRLTLARAILCDPKILILDDALSAVDTHTEERILVGLRRFMAERTSILISHRISTVRDADHIVVLDDGRIAEQGTHAALVAAGGQYAEMHHRQLLEQSLEEQA